MRIKTRLALTLITLSLLPASNALAQCVAGAPCVSGDYTATDPDSTTGNDSKRGNAETCDGDFMNQIYARAFIEAERETVMAQTYIRKPDSVLEYTCFDSFLNVVADRAAPIFSETTEWQNATIPLNIRYAGAGNPSEIPLRVYMGDGHIEPNLTAVVSNALNAYIDSNFSHDFLGGFADGIDHSMASSVSGGAYACSMMHTIWEAASCANFEDAATTFPTFAELAASDPRTLPDLGGCNVGSVLTTELIATAANAGPAYATATHDPISVYLDIISPVGSTHAADCGDPVRTGLNVFAYSYGATITPTASNPSGVTRNDEDDIEESVCINPGCYYNSVSESCESG